MDKRRAGEETRVEEKQYGHRRRFKDKEEETSRV